VKALTRKVLLYTMNPEENLRKTVENDIMSFSMIYVVSEATATIRVLSKETIVPAIDTQRNLLAFFSMETAREYAVLSGAVLDGAAMVICLSKSEFVQCLSKQMRERSVGAVRAYARAPVSIVVPTGVFIPTFKEPNIPHRSVAEGEFALVSEIKDVLDNHSKAERRALDPAKNYENPHTLLEKLLQANLISYEELDREMDLPVGFTSNYCHDLSSTAIAKEELKKILAKFGLQEYLYQFKGHCSELATEIKQNPALDTYNVKPAQISTKERFSLTRVRRGKDQINNAFVYGLSLKSGVLRTIDVVVTSPFGYEAGKEYEIGGLEPLIDESGEKSLMDVQRMPTPEEEAARDEKIAKRAEKKPLQKPKFEADGEDETDPRRDEIIKYFKRIRGDNYNAAKAAYDSLTAHEDILEEFYQHIKRGKTRNLEVRGYSIRRLTSKLNYSLYDACLMLMKLRKDPQPTLQELKYRETNPQYQKNVGGDGQKEGK